MSPFSKRDKLFTLVTPVAMWLLGFATCYFLHTRGLL